METLWTEKFILYYFPDHPLSKVRHVRLRKCEPRSSGAVFCKLAGKHPAVGSVHLLGNLLGDNLFPTGHVKI